MHKSPDEMSPPLVVHHTSGLVPIAPATNTDVKVPPQDDAADLMPYTCVTCAKRKVKCDKAKPPCAACRKGRLECFYQAPAPRKRKRKATEDVHERLHRFERLLKENGIVPPPAPDEEPSPPAAASESAVRPTAEPRSKSNLPQRSAPVAGSLLKGPGKTRYVDSQLWRNLGDDLHPSSDEEDDFHNDDDDTPGDLPDPASSAFMATGSPSVDLLHLHPPYETALKMWKVYTTHIDPVLKVVHVPSGLELVQRAAANPSNMSKVTESLLFSIYHFVVSVISDQECEEMFGQPRKPLRASYSYALRQSLVCCGFLRTTELMVLQAYLLYLVSTRNRGDVHTLWILTGIAVRIAQRMGLHRDGEDLGLNPYDVEMRRRIFWQVVTLDAMVSQLCGTGLATSRDTFNTKRPSNIDDVDIWPGMSEPPVVKKSATDMMFCLVRTEMGVFHSTHNLKLGNWSDMANSRNLKELEASVSELENLMEENYIRYCDITNPVHCMALALVRGAMNGMRLRIRVPRAKSGGATLEERKELSTLALKCMAMEYAVLQNAQLQRYQWHMRGVFMGDPIIWVLGEIRHVNPQLDIEEAWRLIASIYETRTEFSSLKRAIFVALARLVLKAWEATNARPNLQIAEPAFIASLRKAFSRREASRNSTETPPPPFHNTYNPFDLHIGGDSSSSSDSARGLPTPFPTNDAAAGIPNYLGFGFVNDFNIDANWLFWDQLTAAPQPVNPQQQIPTASNMFIPGPTS